MSKLRLNMMMSLDGYSAGPEQSEENPFGIGGMQLNQWLFPLRAFREMQGEERGEVNASTPIGPRLPRSRNAPIRQSRQPPPPAGAGGRGGSTRRDPPALPLRVMSKVYSTCRWSAPRVSERN
jgi:hypothetical protein